MKFINPLIILSLLSFPLHAEETSPERIVKDTVSEVLAVLDDKSLDDVAQKAMVFELVKKRINFKEMSRRILARNWKQISEAQKTEFIALFEQILLNTYWFRIKDYSGEKIKYISVSQTDPDHVTVDTIISKNKDSIEIPISYRMKRFVNIWFAYDFTVENLSLVQNYRDEYRGTIKNFGIDILLKQMQAEIISFNS